MDRAFRNKTFWCLLLIGILTFAAYSNTFRVPFQFDDHLRIERAEEIRTLNPVKLFDYSKCRFLPYFSFALNYRFGKLDVFGYHAVNFVIHLLAAFVVFFLMKVTLQTPRLRHGYRLDSPWLLSLFTALIFAVHPIQTEAVTYLWQRTESMLGLFYLGTLLCYAVLRMELEKDVGANNHSPLLYAAYLGSAVAAAFTKPLAVTLPLAVSAYDFCFFRTHRLKKEVLRRLYLPLFLIAFLPLALALFDRNETLQANIYPSPAEVHSRTLGQYGQYYGTKLRVLANALVLMLFPHSQSLEYDFPWTRSLFNPLSTFLSLLLTLLLFFAAFFRRKKWAVLSFGILFFFITMGLRFILILGDLFCEHSLYLPILAPAMLFPVFTYWLFRKFKLTGNAWIMCLALVICTSVFFTYRRNLVWGTEISLWEDASRKAPNKSRIHYQLGTLYLLENRLNEAFKELWWAVKLKPDFAEAHFQLGEYYAVQNKLASAISSYNTATLFNKNFFAPHLQLAVCYAATGRFDAAKTSLSNARKAVINPFQERKVEETRRKLTALYPGQF